MSAAAELLAPAGDPEAGYAALHYGADALYLGLGRFSARAEAANFTLDQLGEIVAYAHSLQPRRRVYVTVNTLVLDAELPALAAQLVQAAAREVDAVIVQDLGVARLARRHVPELRLHASTQLAVHNVAGARAAAELGFSRVTLARELTLDEIGRIVAAGGIETEAFVHGALCYSYSGLCLFSSLMRGPSGNRGRCKYPCRDRCQVTGTGEEGFPFSMKDLAVREDARRLRDAGVTSLKIEGRMKSALYVATVVNAYRRLLDGHLAPEQARELEADMQSVFARPWTRLYLDGAAQRGAVDPAAVGHRGVPVGTVEGVRRGARGARDVVRFRTRRRLERHDGLQIDLPGRGKPFGFALDDLQVQTGNGRPCAAFEAPAGAWVEAALPDPHPDIPAGAAVYGASSQAVKRGYGYTRPRPGLYRVRRPADVAVEVTPDAIVAEARAGHAVATGRVAGVFAPATDPARTAAAARSAFGKLGDTAFALGTLDCRNPRGLFAPVSLLNELRRQVMGLLAQREEQARAARIAAIEAAMAGELPARRGDSGGTGERWTIKVDRVAYLDDFAAGDWDGVAEVVVDIAREPWETLRTGLARLAAVAGRERVRLALPIVTRGWEEPELARRVEALRAAGWRRWQIANVSGWRLLDRAALDVSADWPVYVLNRQAAAQVMDMGATSFTLSPEDARANMAALVAACGARAAVPVYMDAPLFLSATCPRASLRGCPGPEACDSPPMPLRLAGGERVVVLSERCLTVVVAETPFTLAGRLDELRRAGALSFRADFVWKPYAAADVVGLWRRLRRNEPVAGHVGNYERGLA